MTKVLEIELENFHIDLDLTLTIGNFDGVHIGHVELINKCIQIAKSNYSQSAVLTFWPHPQMLTKAKAPKLIYNKEQKIEYIKELKPDYILIAKFSKNILKISPNVFIDEILCKNLKVKALITGKNFRFGRDRVGDVSTLKKACKKQKISFYSLEKKTKGLVPVSSSKIREFLSMGMVQTSNRLLGRTYSISGYVNHGMKLGKFVNTANINISWKAPILSGVYLVLTKLKEGYHFGVANLGVKPTFSVENKVVLETHLFNFSQNIYGQYLEVKFLAFIRPERKFDLSEELEKQISYDIKKAKYIAEKNFFKTSMNYIFQHFI